MGDSLFQVYVKNIATRLCASLKNDGFETTRGATIYTRTTARTFFVINLGKMIMNGDSAVRAGFFTFFAADASVFACLARIRALILIATHHHSLLGFGHHGNDALRASRCTSTATDANIPIHMRDAVSHADRIHGASRRAITKAETTEAASIGAAIHHGSRAASGDAVVFRLFRGRLAVAVAANESH